MQVIDKKGFLFSLAILVLVSFVFWTQSRFPALDEKAQMGQRTNISALAFETVFPLSAEQGHVERIAYHAINWAYTNWQGMTFGILFATAFLGLLSFLRFPQVSRTNHFLSALKGSLLGVPLGVCANCSTPVAFGMYRSGLPIASAVSMLSSSPTLNIVVLTMSFTLLPFEIVAIKYLFVLIFILLVVPLLVTLIGNVKNRSGENVSSLEGVCSLNADVTWAEVVSSGVKKYLIDLKFIVINTLPFMILAGALAAVLVEFLPIEAFTGADWSFGGIIVASLIAALFPVPIAFDVIISVGLLAMGVSSAYVAAIFFSLGVFSIYPALMVARDLSIKLSLGLMLSVVLLGVLSAYLTATVIDDVHSEQIEEISQLVGETSKLPLKSAKPLVRKAARLCHRLGEPAQYNCFGQFVVQALSTQFNVNACEFLEDAVGYRQTCEENYRYLSLSRTARIMGSIEDCASLTAKFKTACEYDVAFEKVAESQNLSHCSLLIDDRAKTRCIEEGLVLSIELYDDETICESLEGREGSLDCIDMVKEHRVLNRILSRHDLVACMVLDDGSSAGQRKAQHCQGMLMVNQLEQGADISLCGEVGFPYLVARCEMIAQYLSYVRLGDTESCVKVQDLELKSRCEVDAIQQSLLQALSSIRFEHINPYTEVVETTFDASLQKNFDVEPLTFSVNEALSTKKLVVSSYVLSVGDQPGADAFKHIAAEEIGLEDSPQMQMTELFEPFNYGRGISAGDYNRDNWPDLLVAHNNYVELYQNVGGRFKASFKIQFGDELSPMLVAIVDLNNDSWPELFISFYGGSSRIYFNMKGSYETDRFSTITPDNHKLTMSAGFADPDGDGDIDIVLGGWSFGDLRHFNPVYSQNYFAENNTELGSEQFVFELKPLEGEQGESLSVLISDLNDDGVSDLVIANDLDGPDAVYSWKEGGYRLVQNESLPQLSSLNTMSVESGDLNGDLKLDYFSVDMSFGDSDGEDYCTQHGVGSDPACVQLKKSEQALHDGDVSWCDQFSNLQDKSDCLGAQIVQLAKQSRNSDFCAQIPPNQVVVQELCKSASQALPPRTAISLDSYPESKQKNILLLSNKDGFTDKAEDWNALNSYWSWNTKIADLDNDGWQDIYIGNGFMFGGLGRNLHSNVFLHNKKGGRFTRSEKQFGLNDYLNTPSFVTVDFDQDGDLDIISNRVAANLGVFVNQSNNNSISLSLADYSTSTNISESVIGGKIVITSRLGSELEQQIRELKFSGGFLSFDQAVAHFGLAKSELIEHVSVTWPDGEIQTILGDFRSGRHYLLQRLLD